MSTEFTQPDAPDEVSAELIAHGRPDLPVIEGGPLEVPLEQRPSARHRAALAAERERIEALPAPARWNASEEDAS